MTLKKLRYKEFKRLVSLGWPRREASHYVRHGGLSHLGYKSVDDLTLGRHTYFNKDKFQVVYIYEDGRWETIQLTKEEWTPLNLASFYD